MGFGAILGAIAPSIIGGIFNSRENKKTREYNEANKGVDYSKLRADAEKAGFNPLTALLSGGGAGYTTPTYNPAMSSGSFIAEALTRGVDTYFNSVSERNDQATEIRREAEDKRRWEAEMELRKPRASFGYALSDAVPYVPARTATLPKLASNPPPVTASTPRSAVVANRPPVHPFRKDNAMIPVRLPNGTPGEIDASIARRMDIQPFDTVSSGDYVEVVGELTGEGETLVMNKGIRETALGKAAPMVGLKAPGGQAYYPPPFTGSGGGHFSVPPTGMDRALGTPQWY